MFSQTLSTSLTENVCETQTASKIVLSPELSASPFRSTASQIQARITIWRRPQIGFSTQIQLPTNSGKVIVRQAGTMSIDMTVVQASTVAFKFKTICQFILWRKNIGIQIVSVVFE